MIILGLVAAVAALAVAGLLAVVIGRHRRAAQPTGPRTVADLVRLREEAAGGSTGIGPVGARDTHPLPVVRDPGQGDPGSASGPVGHAEGGSAESGDAQRRTAEAPVEPVDGSGPADDRPDAAPEEGVGARDGDAASDKPGAAAVPAPDDTPWGRARRLGGEEPAPAPPTVPAARAAAAAPALAAVEHARTAGDHTRPGKALRLVPPLEGGGVAAGRADAVAPETAVTGSATTEAASTSAPTIELSETGSTATSPAMIPEQRANTDQHSSSPTAPPEAASADVTPADAGPLEETAPVNATADVAESDVAASGGAESDVAAPSVPSGEAPEPEPDLPAVPIPAQRGDGGTSDAGVERPGIDPTPTRTLGISADTSAAGEVSADGAIAGSGAALAGSFTALSRESDPGVALSGAGQLTPQHVDQPGAAQPVRFRAVGPDGAGVAGAEAALLDDRGWQASSTFADQDGSGRLDAPRPGDYVLVATAAGHQPGATAVSVEGGPAEAEVQLLRSAALSGLVHGTDGPIVGAHLTLVQDGEVVHSAESGADGEFRMADVVGGAYGFSVVATGRQPLNVVIDIADGVELRIEVGLDDNPVLGTDTAPETGGDPAIGRH